jgi:hypothetical protein
MAVEEKVKISQHNNQYIKPKEPTRSPANSNANISVKSTKKLSSRTKPASESMEVIGANDAKASVPDLADPYARQTNVSRAMQKLVAKFDAFLSDYRYTMYAEMVYATPHYYFAQGDISVRNHLALYILKNVVNQKIHFPDSGRCLVPATV